MGATFSQWYLVVYLFNGYNLSTLIAKLTKRVGLNITGPDSGPGSSVSTVYSFIPAVLLIVPVMEFLMFITKAVIR